jgi:hypothetical protein
MFESSSKTETVPVGCVRVAVEPESGDSFVLGWFPFRDLNDLVTEIGEWGVRDASDNTYYEAKHVTGGFELWDERATFVITLDRTEDDED